MTKRVKLVEIKDEEKFKMADLLFLSLTVERLITSIKHQIKQIGSSSLYSKTSPNINTTFPTRPN